MRALHLTLGEDFAAFVAYPKACVRCVWVPFIDDDKLLLPAWGESPSLAERLCLDAPLFIGQWQLSLSDSAKDLFVVKLVNVCASARKDSLRPNDRHGPQRFCPALRTELGAIVSLDEAGSV